MQNSLHELKENLVQALDHHNNVVDMEKVFSVIEVLENTTYITKEDLEKTRLGKYINDLRKKTFNRALARRAKGLLKTWAKLVDNTPDINSTENSITNSNSPVNGETVSPTGPGPGPVKTGVRHLLINDNSVLSDSELNDNNSNDLNDSNNVDNNVYNNNHNHSDYNEDQSIGQSISEPICELDVDSNEVVVRVNEVSEAHVDKLLEEKWEYVNGTYDSETEWREWHEMTTAVSYNGEILHILPYVNIN